MSKVDPAKFSRLDRRSSMLIVAAHSHTEAMDEKGVLGVEEPGLDALRGSFGTVGSIIRARTVKRMSQSINRDSHLRPPRTPHVPGETSWTSSDGLGLNGLKRHQLYDAPVPRADDEQSIHSHLVNKRPTIKFGEQDLVHSYSRPGTGDNSARHEHRQAHGLSSGGYPPLPPLPPLPSPREGNLLYMESPDLKRNSSKPSGLSGSEDWTESQTLIIPSLFNSESEVHSAPPTIYSHATRTARPTPSRMDLQGMFDSPNASSLPPVDRTTLLSFPSVTDSAPSEWGDEGLKAKSTKESLRHELRDGVKEKSKDRSRPRSPKRYPRSDDDREERESLWRKTNSVEDDSDAALPPEVGSVRLVQSKRH